MERPRSVPHRGGRSGGGLLGFAALIVGAVGAASAPFAAIGWESIDLARQGGAAPQTIFIGWLALEVACIFCALVLGTVAVKRWRPVGVLLGALGIAVLLADVALTVLVRYGRFGIYW